jgi:hypothetical protein
MKNLKKKVSKKFDEDPLDDYIVTDAERLDINVLVTRRVSNVDKARQKLANSSVKPVPVHRIQGGRGRVRAPANSEDKSGGGARKAPKENSGTGASAAKKAKPSGVISEGQAARGANVTVTTKVLTLEEIEGRQQEQDEYNSVRSDGIDRSGAQFGAPRPESAGQTGHQNVTELMNADRTPPPQPHTSSSSAGQVGSSSCSSSSSPSLLSGPSNSGSGRNTPSALEAAFLASVAESNNDPGSDVTVLPVNTSSVDLLAKFMWRFTPAAQKAARAMGMGPNVIPRKRILELYLEAG